MKKVTYAILTHIPIIGSVIELHTNPMWCSMGKADGAYEKEQELVKAYLKEHPDEAVTRQLIGQLLKDIK